MPIKFDSYCLCISLIPLITGIFIGKYITCEPKCHKRRSAKEPEVTQNNHPKEKNKCKETEAFDSEEDYESDEEDFPVDTTVLNDIPGEVKMSLLIRQDLKMTKGKVAAQCSHAAIKLYKNLLVKNPRLLQKWEASGQAKITLKLDDADQMDLLFAKALSLNLNCCIIHDAGRTQIASGSATVLGIGPAPASVIDEVTRELKLY